jgi:hypothetical protein
MFLFFQIRSRSKLSTSSLNQKKAPLLSEDGVRGAHQVPRIHTLPNRHGFGHQALWKSYVIGLDYSTQAHLPKKEKKIKGFWKNRRVKDTKSGGWDLRGAELQ